MHPAFQAMTAGPGSAPARAETVAFADHPELKDWRVYLRGYPPMVKAARKVAFLMGASLTDIHADPFELQDLRGKPQLVRIQDWAHERSLIV